MFEQPNKIQLRATIGQSAIRMTFAGGPATARF